MREVCSVGTRANPSDTNDNWSSSTQTGVLDILGQQFPSATASIANGLMGIVILEHLAGPSLGSTELENAINTSGKVSFSLLGGCIFFLQERMFLSLASKMFVTTPLKWADL